MLRTTQRSGTENLKKIQAKKTRKQNIQKKITWNWFISWVFGLNFSKFSGLVWTIVSLKPSHFLINLNLNLPLTPHPNRMNLEHVSLTILLGDFRYHIFCISVWFLHFGPYTQALWHKANDNYLRISHIEHSETELEL